MLHRLVLAALLLAIPGESLGAVRDLYVSSRNTNNVKRYDGETGAWVGNFVTNGAGGLSQTQDLAWGPDGHLYVTGFGNSAVLKFHGATGEPLGAFTSGYALTNPTKFAFHSDGFLYVSQWGGSQKIVRFRISDGTFDREFTDTAVFHACQFVWKPSGDLLVAYFGNGSNGGVRRFDPNGTNLGDFDQGNVLQGPVNLWFDGTDSIVLDWTTGSAERLDSAGQHVDTFISGLVNTEGFVFGPTGNLFICDWTLNVVNQYSPGGSLLGVFASGHNLNAPNACVFGLEHPVTAPDVGSGSDSVRLHGAAPNPFRDATRIRFTLETPMLATLRVVDVTGREVARFVNGVVPAGSRSARWDASKLPAGVYWLRLETPAGARSVQVTRVR